MTWLRVDDHIADHPKFIGLGMPAIGLWLCCAAYAARTGDGFVPAALPRRYAGHQARALCERLIASELFEICEEGFRIHDFADYLPKGEIAHAARQRRYRDRRRDGSSDVTRDRTRDAGTDANVTPSRAGSPEPVPEPVYDSSLRSESRKPPAEIIELNGAASFVAAYVDACAEWGSKADKRMKPRVGKAVNELLADGRNREAILWAVGELARRNEPPTSLAYMVRDYELTQAGTPLGRIVAAPIRENPIDADIRRAQEEIRNGVH